MRKCRSDGNEPDADRGESCGRASVRRVRSATTAVPARLSAPQAVSDVRAPCDRTREPKPTMPTHSSVTMTAMMRWESRSVGSPWHRCRNEKTSEVSSVMTMTKKRDVSSADVSSADVSSADVSSADVSSVKKPRPQRLHSKFPPNNGRDRCGPGRAGSAVGPIF